MKKKLDPYQYDVVSSLKFNAFSAHILDRGSGELLPVYHGQCLLTVQIYVLSDLNRPVVTIR